MKRRVRLYEGRSKILYEGNQANTNILFFKDDICDISAANREIIDGKGVLSNRISEQLFSCLKNIGIPTHFIKRINMREQLVTSAEMLPFKVVIRNAAVGYLAKLLGLKHGDEIPQNIIEFYYKNTKIAGSLISEEHIRAFGWANNNELDDIIQYSVRINDFLSGYFSSLQLKLLDIKLEFGRIYNGNSIEIILADELSPETISFYDIENNKYLNYKPNSGLTPNIKDYVRIANKMRLLQKEDVAKNFIPYLVK